MNDQIQTIEVMPTNVVEAQSRAEIDITIATAKRYPRNVDMAIQKSIATVTRNKAIAETCHYSLPRGGKSIQGPSVHLARIIASEYQNIRVDSKVVEIGDTMLTAQSICMDLESNYAVRTEVKRRIVDRNGRRFKEDMIVVTANAALSIAARNAILQVIPRSVSDEIYSAVQKTLLGNLTDEQKLIKKRQDVLKGYKKTYNVEEKEILELLQIETINQIKEPQLLELIGLAQALKDGDTTVQQAFKRTNESGLTDTKKKRQEEIFDDVEPVKPLDKVFDETQKDLKDESEKK